MSALRNVLAIGLLLATVPSTAAARRGCTTDEYQAQCNDAVSGFYADCDEIYPPEDGASFPVFPYCNFDSNGCLDGANTSYYGCTVPGGGSSGDACRGDADCLTNLICSYTDGYQCENSLPPI